MNQKVIVSIAIALLIIGTFASVYADSWELPKKEKYYAPNKKYYLRTLWQQ